MDSGSGKYIKCNVNTGCDKLHGVRIISQQISELRRVGYELSQITNSFHDIVWKHIMPYKAVM